jgi:hypothetical protein
MSNLADISYEEIETNIMKILINNEGILYTYNTLFSKLIDKMDSNLKFIDQNFKFKFMLILKTLDSHYEDIHSYNENGINYIYYGGKINKSQENTTINNHILPSDSELNVYIVDNNMKEHFSKDANTFTIYHDLVNGKNYYQVKKMIETNSFDYLIVDNKKETPLYYINDMRIANLFIEKLYKKIAILENDNVNMQLDIIKLSERINELKHPNDITVIEFIKYKLIDVFDKYYSFIILIIALIIGLLYL